MEAPGLACERAFLDDECESDAALEPERPVTYESLRPIEELPVLAFSVAYELEIAGLVRMLNAARHSGPAPRPRRAPSARHRGRAAHVLQPDAARRHRRRDRRRRGRRARRRRRCARPRRGGPREAQLDAPRGDPARLRPRAPQDPAAGRRGGRRHLAGALGHPHAEHRAGGHVPHRDRARVLARLQLLRDAPIDQRRDAHRPGRAGARGDPARTRGVSGLVGAAVERPPENRLDRRRSGRPRMRGGPLVAAARPPRQHRGLRRRARARRLPHAHDRDGRHQRARARDARPPRPAQAPRCSARSSRRSTGWTGSSST